MMTLSLTYVSRADDALKSGVWGKKKKKKKKKKKQKRTR